MASQRRATRSLISTTVAFAGCLGLVAILCSRSTGTVELATPESGSQAFSPLGLAEEDIEVKLDIWEYRWLWWPIILYLFWGMAYVCDEYFVHTIEVISERFSIPDDVAGATLMALGCNGPEMALNTISIFHPSPIGVGAVVGGEVFNVLVIIGAAVLATPDMYLPVKLVSFSFFRDVIFYMISVAMLYWVLKDGMVTPSNAATLLGGAVCYTLTVVYSSTILAFWNKEARIVKAATKRFTMPRMNSARMTGRLLAATDDESDTESEVDEEACEAWNQARENLDPESGSILGVRLDMRNRLMDRGRCSVPRYMWLHEDALVVSAFQNPVDDSNTVFARASTGIVYDHDKKTRDHHWHHGGLVNQPKFDEEAAKSAPVAGVSGFKDAPWEVIPLEDFLYCEWGSDQKHFNLHVRQHDAQSLLGRLITLELSAQEAPVMEAWVAAIRQRLLDQKRRTTEAPPAKGCMASLMEWVEWIQFPVEFFVSRTIPDMGDPKQQYLYPLSFFMSMVWLAIFAYSVTKACDGIHHDFGISQDILGFTVAAAGTSFPNVFSGMCVAKQGKTSMAVANALGANVQNVFLALAVPWCIQSFFITHGPFPMPVSNLLPAVLECVITLMPVVLIYICCGFSMPRWSGAVYLLTYLGYVVVALGQQTYKCPTWPFNCGSALLGAP